MGKRPRKLTIERIDNDGDYEKKNCRWATHREQGTNTSKNIRIKFYDMDLTLTEWGRLLNIKEGTLRHRFKIGWPAQKAFTTPVGYRMK